MKALWVSAITIGLVALVLLTVGIVLMIRAKPGVQIKGGFGGPAGSSDVGTAGGFGVSDPITWYQTGRWYRLAGTLGLVVATILAVAGVIAS